MITTSFILTGLIIFFAAFTQGLTGFGYAMVALTLLSFLMDLNQSVPLAAMHGLVINIYLIVYLKAHIKLSEVRNLIIGAVVGIPLGAYVLLITSPDILELILGIVILLFVFLSFAKIVKQEGLSNNWGYLFGLSAGILGGSLNTNGPPVLIYFFLKGWDKLKQKAAITGFFIFTSVTVVITHAVTGITTKAIFLDFLIYLPFVIIGLILGNYLFYKVSSKIYNKLLLSFLLIMALLMIFG